MDKPRVFLDSSALFSAIYSETGGARMILKLGEAGLLSLCIGPWVLKEVEGVLDRKSPKSKAYFALLLDRSGINIADNSNPDDFRFANSMIDYLPDVKIVAEALSIKADFFVTFDKKHLIGNPKAVRLPFPIGTAGDFLVWFRTKLSET